MEANLFASAYEVVKRLDSFLPRGKQSRPNPGLCLDDNMLKVEGNYSSWAQASEASSGYDGEAILLKTRDALLKVKNGQAVYERDSVLFNEIHYSWPVLAGLMTAAANNRGVLNVLDFGGSLGSTYFQNRFFLQQLKSVQWNIVEQRSHVEVGKAHFESDELRFYRNIDECAAEANPGVILLSSVMQYLESPFEAVDALSRSSSKHMIIDRTALWDGARDLICVQHVPSSIYKASYPSWIFSRERFWRRLEDLGWNTLAMFTNSDKLPGPVDFEYGGAILVKQGQI
jgi:putative methyltransferase (TIGR04325 family)